MRRAIAGLALALLVGGCDEEEPVQKAPVKKGSSVKKGLSFQEQQEKQLKAELEKIQSEINENFQKQMKMGQDALKSARPRVPR